MRTGPASTAHYAAVIADLRAEITKLESEAHEAEQIAKAKAQAAADLQRTIETLTLRIGAHTNDSHPETGQANDGATYGANDRHARPDNRLGLTPIHELLSPVHIALVQVLAQLANLVAIWADDDIAFLV